MWPRLRVCPPTGQPKCWLKHGPFKWVQVGTARASAWQGDGRRDVWKQNQTKCSNNLVGEHDDRPASILRASRVRSHWGLRSVLGRSPCHCSHFTDEQSLESLWWPRDVCPGISGFQPLSLSHDSKRKVLSLPVVVLENAVSVFWLDGYPAWPLVFLSHTWVPLSLTSSWLGRSCPLFSFCQGTGELDKLCHSRWSSW